MFVCTHCGATRPQPTPCPDHPEEAVLDSSERGVRKLLARLDADQLKLELYDACTLGVIVGMGTGYSLIESAQVGFWGQLAVLTAMVGGFVLTAAWWAKRKHRPRFANVAG